MIKPLEKGELVVMHTCGEAEHYDGKLWKCKTDEFIPSSGSPVVFLEGFSGYFLCQYLQRVDVKVLTNELERLYSERYLRK